MCTDHWYQIALLKSHYSDAMKAAQGRLREFGFCRMKEPLEVGMIIANHFKLLRTQSFWLSPSSWYSSHSSSTSGKTLWSKLNTIQETSIHIKSKFLLQEERKHSVYPHHNWLPLQFNDELHLLRGGAHEEWNTNNWVQSPGILHVIFLLGKLY